jgi:nucleoid-associated protein YgaU
MRTDAKVGIVAVLILVVLVIIYFAFHKSSNQTAENNALPSAQPALVESPTLPGSSPVPPALTPISQTQPGLISLPATTATSMPANAPGMTPTATSMPAPALDQTASSTPTAGSTAPATPDNTGPALSLNTPPTDNSAASTNNTNTGVATVNNGTGANANTNATLNFPPVTSSNQNQTGSSGSLTSGTVVSRRHHRSRTLSLSAPHSGIYVVRKGDTLAVISRRIYGSEGMIHALERANPGLDPRRMRIGQKIHLPRRSHVAMTSRHHAYRSTTSTGRGRTYVVRAGEDLSGIARKFYGNPGLWKRIYNANRRVIGSSPNKLRAGERIVIPPK